MYFQVYYHPTARSFEVVLEAIYQRILDLHREGYRFEAKIGTFIKVLNDSNNLDAYNELDDYYVTGFIKQLSHSKDKILARLCNAFLYRHLFKVIDLADDPDPAFIEELKNKYKDDKYFIKFVSAKGQAYMHSKKRDINDIKVLLPNGSVKSLDKYSPIIKSLVSSSYTEINRIYYFED
jgi:HD superfamily phosphohydrolase